MNYRRYPHAGVYGALAVSGIIYIGIIITGWLDFWDTVSYTIFEIAMGIWWFGMFGLIVLG
ncbi:MAG: hypothetical protein AB1744_12715 [Candidatus Zixiibacteriota bacterium]